MGAVISPPMNAQLLILTIVFTSAVFTPSSQQEIIYFYEEGCPECAALLPVVEEISQEYNLTIISYDVGTVQGYALFNEHGFTTTPALVINGRKLEGIIKREDIIRLLGGDKDYEWYHYLVSLILGLVSGLSPTLMGMHADIISEVARTSRNEIDVVMRSLLFYVGILTVAFCLFYVFNSIYSLHIVVVFLGFVLSINLLNSGLHSFNSYTRIDLYIKAKYITLEPRSVVYLGFLHGFLKFADSVPLFIFLMWLVITRGSFADDLIVVLLFCAGVVILYFIMLTMAIAQINLFRQFKDSFASQIYFSLAGFAVMAGSLWLLWEIRNEIVVWVAVILTVVVAGLSGILIGFKRRIVY